MNRRRPMCRTFAAVSAAVGLFFSSATHALSADDPYEARIVRVIYKWGASWGFMAYTAPNGRLCVRFGDPGFRPKADDITNANHKVCFEPGQTTIEHSPISASRSFVVEQSREATVETYYHATAARMGETLDMTFEECTLVAGDPDFRCSKPTHYVVRLRGERCEVDITDNRVAGKTYKKMCEHYSAN